MKSNRIITADEAARLVADAAESFAFVPNPSYVHPPFDLYPLPRKAETLAGGMAGAVMDMDGTTTTTEPLCIHSLDMMVRRATGRAEDPTWPGLDRARDYPHIIGNSTTKHVEYLVRTYQDRFQFEALQVHYVQAVAWTLGQGSDEGRKRDVRSTCAAIGIAPMLEDSDFLSLMNPGVFNTPEGANAALSLARRYGPAMDLSNLTALVRVCIDVYYHRYHDILSRIAAGRGAEAAREVFGQVGGHLIQPMTGIGFFLALIKGWLGEDAGFCFEPFRDHIRRCGRNVDEALIERNRAFLVPMSHYFTQHPASVAIVTSSIRYEAHIVLTEVFRVLCEEIALWDIPGSRRDALIERFTDYTRIYDAFITATDSSEIRLKPHRDLYCIALHEMGIAPTDYPRVVGFEDSESGTFAIRAAGIPVCCALPFPETEGHSFDAASYIAYGGIPEVVLAKLAFLPPNMLAS